MDQKENFLTKAYKNLFFNPNEKESAEKEVKINEVLDKKGGIFDISENKIFNTDGKNDIFRNAGKKSIFDKTVKGKFSLKSKGSSKKKSTNSSMNNIFNSFNTRELGFNKGEMPPGLGNNFDRIG